MTLDQEAIVLALYFGLCIGFVGGVILTGGIITLQRWCTRDRKRRPRHG